MEPNQTPVTPAPSEPVAVEPAAKTSYGALAGLVIVVLAIAGASMYFLSTRVGDGYVMSADVESLTSQSDSTDEAAIESDLTAESPDSFDKDLDAAYGELDASFEAQ